MFLTTESTHFLSYPETSEAVDAADAPQLFSTPNHQPFPEQRSGSPSRNTFDIDSPELRKFITRGKKPDGLPFTNLKLGFGMAERKLVEASHKALL